MAEIEINFFYVAQGASLFEADVYIPGVLELNALYTSAFQSKDDPLWGLSKQNLSKSSCVA